MNIETTLTTKLIGKTYEWTYSNAMRGKVTFTENKANWEILDGPNKGESDSNSYQARDCSGGVFFVQWHEPKYKITVTLLINEKTSKVYSSVVSPEALEFDVGVIH